MSVKFSEFVVKTTKNNIQYLVGYNGTENVQITPNNFLSSYVPYTGATTDVNLGSKNIYVNNAFGGFSSITASGTQIVLTVASVGNYLVSGSGGQTIKLPDTTTLPLGAVYYFNNNQSSGAILVNNNSNTLVKSVPSGAHMILELTDNSNAAGTWDAHFQAPSNASWSTNTLDWAGSITSATWNGVAVAINRGGTGATTAATALSNLGGASSATTITINGSTQSLAANRTWSVGTVTFGTGVNDGGFVPNMNGTNILGQSIIYYDALESFIGFGATQRNSEKFGLKGGIYMRNLPDGDIMLVDNSADNTVLLIEGDGSISNSTGTYGTISDRNLKENIIPATSKLDDLMKVNIVNYNLISDENKLKQIGVIAQELEEIFPGLVTTNKDGMKSVKTSVMIPILIKAVQELKQLIK